MATLTSNIVDESISEMSPVTESVNKANEKISSKDEKSTNDSVKLRKKRKTKDVDNKAAAITAANVTFLIGRMIAGSEGAPSKELNEESNMIDAYDVYFKSKDIHDIPPGCALLVVLGAYAIRIIRVEKAQSKMDKIYGFFRKMFKSRGLKLNATQSDNRNDRKWKDNTG